MTLEKIISPLCKSHKQKRNSEEHCNILQSVICCKRLHSSFLIHRSVPSDSDISRYIQACRASAIYGMAIYWRYTHKRVPALVLRYLVWFGLVWLYLIAESMLAAGSNAGIEVFGLVTMGTIGARQGPPDLSVDKPSREHFPRLYIKTHIFFLQSNLICYPT